MPSRVISPLKFSTFHSEFVEEEEEPRSQRHWLKPFTPYLENLQATSKILFTLYGGLSSFCLYVCVYVYRRSFQVVPLDEKWTEDIYLKDAVVFAQTAGLLIAKLYGIQYNAEAKRYNVTVHLLVAIAAAECSLIAYAVVENFWKPFAIFFNGLPLGVVWGLLVTFLEGRETSDAMLLMLAEGFLIGNGLVKAVCKWVLDRGRIDKFVMPAVMGAAVYPLVLFFSWLLYQFPGPSRADEHSRTARMAMFSKEREIFVNSQWVGLCLLFFAYMFLMAFKEFRDFYMNDILSERGEQVDFGKYLITDVSSGLLIMACLGGSGCIKDSRRAMQFIFLMSGFGSAIIFTTLIMDLALGLGTNVWWILLGAGNYIGYVAYNSIAFERLIAYTRFDSTLAFPMVLCDLAGYLGSVSTLLFAPLSNKLAVLRVLGFVGSIVTMILWALATAYYLIVFVRSPTSSCGSSRSYMGSTRSIGRSKGRRTPHGVHLTPPPPLAAQSSTS